MNVRSQTALLTMLVVLQVHLVAVQQPANQQQVPIPPGFGVRVAQPTLEQPTQPAPASVAPQTSPAQAPAPSPIAGAPQALGGLNLQNVALTEVIDFLARQLKLNYILDPRVRGSVSINTYGETKELDPRSLLDLILRINGAAMVQTGSVYRIVPLAELSRMPLRPEVDQKNLPEDDRPILNMIFLKYASVDELVKLVDQFLGPEGRSWAYQPANLLMVLDSRRSMKRTMDLISMFDSDSLAKQRVRLFETRNGRPSELVKELDGLLKSLSLSKELTTIRFIPVDRINMIIAVAPNPGAFAQVEEWLNRLDVKVKSAAGKIDTFVYRVKYGRAEFLASSIMMLYSSMYPGMYGGMGGMYGGMGGMYGGMGGMYGGMGGMYGGMGGGMGMMPGYGGGMGGGYGMMGQNFASPYSTMGAAAMGGGGGGGGGGNVSVPGLAGSPLVGGGGTGGLATGAMDQSGMYLSGGMGMGMMANAHPRVVPNFMDNTLLILGTPEEYEGIVKLLRELDVPPRQVLIEAKIYEVSLTGAFSFGIDYYLRQKGGSAGPGVTTLNALGAITASGIGLTVGALVDASRELLVVLNASETQGKTKVISTPSIIATDSVPASINVGVEVPTLSAQAVTGAVSSGNSLFANTIQNRSTGVTLNILSRINPSGIVTLVINQEVSAPQPPQVGGIQSPSFSKRSVQTQITLNDGDTIAIGGIIADQGSETSSGLPLLHRLPFIGYAFGGKSTNRARTELVVFMTPKVIYDTNDMTEASDEVRSKLRRLQKVIQD